MMDDHGVRRWNVEAGFNDRCRNQYVEFSVIESGHDIFEFAGSFGNDVITDFQVETVDFSLNNVPGDLLDLTAFGIYGVSDLSSDQNYYGRDFAGSFDNYLNYLTETTGGVENSGLASWGWAGPDQTDLVLTFDNGSSLTLLGVSAGDFGPNGVLNDVGSLITNSLVDENGSTGSAGGF